MAAVDALSLAATAPGIPGVRLDVSRPSQPGPPTTMQPDGSRLTLAILESALDCVIVMDAEGRVLEFNRSAVETFGYSREEAIGAELAELIVPAALRDRHRAGLRRFVDTGQAAILNRRIEMSAVCADGRELPVELTVTAMTDAGSPLFVAYLRDLSEQHRSQRGRRPARRRPGIGAVGVRAGGGRPGPRRARRGTALRGRSVVG